MNRISIFTIIFVTVSFAVASAQVDTLMLVEIGSIQAPSAIIELYVEDLDGDSLKEIILCTSSYVYIYDSQTYQVEWTSPPLNVPTDLLFEDINNDGLIDLSVQDSTNIHLFDPHTPQAIWTSPPLDSTYRCYTVGDRDNDDWADVVIVRKEWFTRPGIENNVDTVWLDIYQGPDFIQVNQLTLLMTNYGMGNVGDSWSRFEDPKFIYTLEFINNGVSNSIFAIFTTIEYHSTGPMQSYSYITTGDLWLVNAEYLNLFYTAGCGQFLEFRKMELDDETVLHTLGHRYDRYGSMYGDGRNRYKYVNSFSIESPLGSLVLWSYVNGSGYDWNGYIWGEINVPNPGEEICFSVYPDQTLVSFPLLDTLWQSQSAAGLVKFIFRNPLIFPSPRIVYKLFNPEYEYHFFNTYDGSLSAILPDSGIELSKIADLNGDDNDEILSIQGTSLYIYDLDYATDAGEDSPLPYRAFLRPNYPNPFNSQTTIEYGLPEAGRVRIDIYDLLGRKVETLVDEEMQAGRHRVVWDASGHSSGVYFYRIKAGDFVDTKRMVYLK
jgi:hypothetical protein